MRLRMRRSATVLTVLVAVFVAGGFWLWRYSRGSVDFLVCRWSFDRALAREGPEIERQSRKGLSNVYYFTSYYLNGMLSGFEGTGDVRVLERALGYMDIMVAAARPFEDHGKTFRVWAPFSVSSFSPSPRPVLHQCLQAAVPLARAAAIIRADPALRKRYEGTARRYEAFLDQAVYRYIYQRQLNGQLPWLDPEASPVWNGNASNLGLVMGYLCRAGGARQHCELAEKIGREFKAKLVPYRSGWIWENQTIAVGSDTDDIPGSLGNLAGVPDTAHSSREAFLMVAFHELGLLFDDGDLRRMAGTFTDTLWDQSLESPGFANYLNGRNLPYRVYKEPGLNGAVYHGWAMLGRYSPKAQRVLIAVVTASLLRRTNPAIERNMTSYGGELGLTGTILRNFQPK